MKQKRFTIFKRISLLAFALITILGLLFMGITYYATTTFHLASTELLNKDVAAHIAKFASPFERNGINKRKADSVFQHVMILNPSTEVYFLDTTGSIMDFYGPKKDIKLWKISLEKIKKYILSEGEEYLKSQDPRDPSNDKIFSAAEVVSDSKRLGFIYVILGSNEYKNVSEMLFKSHVGNLAIKAFAFIIILSIVFSMLYINRIRRSFDSMINVLGKFENGDFQARFKIKEQHELAPITRAFNKMADLLVHNVNRLTGLENTRKDFIAHISHDLRTPLAIVRGYAETLFIKMQDGSLTREDQDNYIQIILNKIFNVEHLVTMLFELSKIESPAFKLTTEPFVLSEIVQETVNTFQLPAKEKSIDLKCTECLYHVWVNADVGMMERVIQNLLENAVKNTPADGIIKVWLNVENDYLVFNIENTGEPLPPALVAWIDSPAINDESFSKPSGSGLGLLIVRKILSRHGAQLRGSVTENATNLFSFSLQIVTPQTS